MNVMFRDMLSEILPGLESDMANLINSADKVDPLLVSPIHYFLVSYFS